MMKLRCRTLSIARLAALIVLVTLVAPAAPGLAAEEAAVGSALPQTIVLVRHAEKASEPKDDPPLIAAGRRRAQALVWKLEASGVTGIFSTDFRRTRDTVAPLAAELALEIHEISGRDPAADAAEILAEGGRLSVVAGHSNTLGPLVEALGAPRPEPIDESDYDRFYVVTVYAPGKATVLRMDHRPGW